MFVKDYEGDGVEMPAPGADVNSRLRCALSFLALRGVEKDFLDRSHSVYVRGSHAATVRVGAAPLVRRRRVVRGKAALAAMCRASSLMCCSASGSESLERALAR